MVVVVVVVVVGGWRSDGCYEMVSRCRRSPMYDSRSTLIEAPSRNKTRKI